jgi:hypothetical protein
MRIKTENLDAGNLVNLLNEAIQKVAEDIVDREEVILKRKIVLGVTFKPQEAFVEVEYDIDVKLPKDPARKSVAFVDPNKKELVSELNLKRENVPTAVRAMKSSVNSGGE